MQKRQQDRFLYFRELAATCKEYYIPYIDQHKKLEAGQYVLEIGCGDGGNLLPFAQMGCNVVGVDISESRIKDAIRFFHANQFQATFIASDIFMTEGLEHKFDLVICHDVLEHIEDKTLFISNLKNYIKNDGIIFMSFPPWQMPFGGHQQICASKAMSHLPFVHILPAFLYRGLLKLCKEDKNTVAELLDIKHTRCTIERFQKIARQTNYRIVDRQLYLINPHYKIKFGLKPRKLPSALASISYIRNYLSTSCFYILKA